MGFPAVTPAFIPPNLKRIARASVGGQPLEGRDIDLPLPCLGLLRRYEHARLTQELAGEADWAQRVETLLTEAAGSASPLTRDRLLGIVRHSLGKRLVGLPASAPEPAIGD